MYGNSLGTIVNCGVEGGTISGANSAGAKGIVTGGITGRTNGIVDGCYNKATISSTNSVYNRQDYGNATAGGIIGQSTQVSKTLNCYNTGSVTSIGEYANACGISGGVDYRGGVVENCYNIGKISGSGRTDNYFSGISRTINSWTSNTSTRITNCYCSTDTNYAYFSGRTGFGTGRVASETIKTYATTLGPAYENDDWNINDGYPILWWEAPTIQLNKRQAYINKNEQLQLSIVGANCNVPVPELENLEITNFKWTSSNEDIATVTGEGLITGLKEGYTTIYGKYTNAEGKEIYAMCIVNVADENQVAMPQVETGENFTTILKPDGTVWTIGNGNYGKLGIGNTEESIDPQQVKISETEDLTNVVKIAVGANHVLALTKDREVYAWGDNTYGQLGTNSTEPSNYAIKVSGEGGSSTLNRIIDISAGQYGSSAINEFGWVYAWGDGTYGEMGNGTTKALNSSPVKTVLNNGITVSTGAGHNVELAQNGKVFTWGRNNAGQLGIGSTSNSTTVLRAFSNATEISASGCETVVKDIDKKVYVAGLNTTGQLGDGKYANITKLTETILPEEAAPTTTGGEEIEEPQEPQIIPAINPVKYIKAGTGTIAIQLKDGAVYTIGFNTRGQLGNGENTNKTEFIRAQAY